jgi:bifunctional UDP-N-acetylglucosamine pyrophosphorylase/glucosamine-1-phosphate N-acetyltransferase
VPSGLIVVIILIEYNNPGEIMSGSPRKIKALILAAGKGTRMKSDLPKVLHPLMGKPMVEYVITACRKASVDESILVIGHQAALVREILGPEHKYVEQKEQLGTGHAVMVSRGTLKQYKGDLLVLAGDTPFLTSQIIRKLIGKHQKTGAAATLMTAVMDPPPAYGRIVRINGKISRIVEERDATPDERKIKEVNTSHYCFKAEKLFPCLDRLSTDNDQGEYYLTDVIQMLVNQQETVESLTSHDPAVLMGINNRLHLAEAYALMSRQIRNHWMKQGVSMPYPESVYIEPDVSIGTDTTLYPGVSLSGKTRIGKQCRIGPQVRIADADIPDGCAIEFSVIEKRKLKKGSVIGPFAFLTGDP